MALPLLGYDLIYYAFLVLFPGFLTPQQRSVVLLVPCRSLRRFSAPLQHLQRLFGDRNDFAGRLCYHIVAEAVGEVLFWEMVSRGVRGYNQLFPLRLFFAAFGELQLLSDGPLEQVIESLRDFPVFDQIGPEREPMEGEVLTRGLELLSADTFVEELRLLNRFEHFLPLLNDFEGELRDLPFGNDRDQSLLEGQRQKLLLPIVGASEAVALGKEEDVLVVVQVLLAPVESHFAVQNQVEALRVFLLLVDEGFLPELGQEHRAADQVNRGEVPYALYGFELSGKGNTLIRVRASRLISATVRF